MHMFAHEIAAILVILLTIYLSVRRNTDRKDRSNPFSFLNLVIIGSFLALWILLFPVLEISPESAHASPVVSFFERLVLSFHSSLQAFTINIDPSSILEQIQQKAPDHSFYLVLTGFLIVLCPFLLIGYVVSIFSSVSAHLFLALSRAKEWFVFSELNSHSVTLAEDLRKNHPKAGILFTNCPEQERDPELAASAKQLKAVLMPEDILSASLPRTDSPVCIFEIDRDEASCLPKSLKLIRKYGDRPSYSLYVFSSRPEAELLLENAHDGKMKVRRFNEIRSVVSGFLYEEGYEALFRPVEESEDRTISAMVLGLGEYGKTMFKSLAWYCQMDGGYHLCLNAFDRNPVQGSILKRQCPELLEERNNASDEDAEYEINVYSNIDVESEEMESKIRGILDSAGGISFVFIALGNDELNIRTAVEMRSLLKRYGLKPVIRTVLHSSEEKDALKDIRHFDGQGYDIGYIGDERTVYSEANVLSSELESVALDCHLFWSRVEKKPEEEIRRQEGLFWKHDYYYHSSVATAIHQRLKQQMGILDEEGKAASKELEDRSARIEKKRWNAYTRSLGYTYGAHRDDLAKVHNKLIPWSKLSDTDRQKDYLNIRTKKSR